MSGAPQPVRRETSVTGCSSQRSEDRKSYHALGVGVSVKTERQGRERVPGKKSILGIEL